MHDENTCKKYWKDAEKQDPSEIKTAHRIIVGGKYCYNPSIYGKKGWCELADKPSKWGVCSPMCDSEIMKVRNVHVQLEITVHLLHDNESKGHFGFFLYHFFR